MKQFIKKLFGRERPSPEIDVQFKEIIKKMSNDEFWNLVKSFFPRCFLTSKINKLCPIEEKRSIIKKYQKGIYKLSPTTIILEDCEYLGGAPTKGGGISFFYHPNSRSIVNMGFDDENKITFLVEHLTTFLKGIEDIDDFLYQELLKLDEGSITVKSLPIIDRQICVECGGSVRSHFPTFAQGSGKFVNRIPVLDDDQTKIDNGHPYWWGEYVCAECDHKNRKEIK